jgi:uncharacterized repeat protein (TIGR03943 family)
VKRPLQALLLLLSGLGLLHATLLTDHYLRYVKKGMHPLLVASGALLIVLAAAEAWSLWRQGRTGEQEGHGDEYQPDDEHQPEGKHEPEGKYQPDDGHEPDDEHGHGHDHSAPPRVAWLLFLPALSLLFYAPPAIGAYTASREPPKAVTITEQDDFDPLPKTSPLPMTLTDFTRRVQQDRDRAIDGRTVQLTGFVTPDRATSGDEGDEGDGGGKAGWHLTRVIFSCCAADAQFVKVRVHGIPAPPADTWVTLTGTWHPTGTLGTSSAEAALDAHSVKKIPRPYNDYTDGLPLPLS